MFQAHPPPTQEDEKNIMLIEVESDDAEDIAAVIQRFIRAGRDEAYIAAAALKGCSLARSRVITARRTARPRQWGITRDDFAPRPRLVGESSRRGR